MSFDNLTLAGLLVTLPYIAMLIMFSNKKSTTKHSEPLIFDCKDNEPYRYGT